MRDPGAYDNEPIYIEDSDEEEPALAVHSHNITSTSTRPLNNVLGDGSPGPSSEQSPLVVQQGHSRGRAGQSSVRQLDYEGVCVDAEATIKRQRYLEATGKAPAAQQEVKQESSDPLQREVQQDDIDKLLQDIEEVPQLFDQLLRGEGSSSNPRHIWRQRVFAALQQQQQQQQEMALSSQPTSQQVHSKRPRQLDSDEDGGVIADSQDEDEEQPEVQPAKRQRTMPPAGGDAGAGSSKQQASRRTPQQQQQAQQQQQEEPEGEQPVPAARAPSKQQGRAQQQTRTGRPPAARPPRQQQRKEQPSNNAVGTAAAAAAAAAAGSSGGVGGHSDSGPAADEQCEKVRRRALRAKLTRLEAEAAANKSLLLDCSSGELASRLLKLADLGAQATRPREAAQHAGVLSALSKDAVDMIHAFHNERRGRNPASLVSALTAHFPANPAAAAAAALQGGPVQLDWAALGAHTTHLFRTGPGVASMLGALAGVAKARRVAVRQARAPPEPEVQPVVGDAALLAEHGLGQETERVVTDMRRVLQREGRCGLVQLVLDHDSFAHTLENVFALSFLCKDMFVSLHEDKEKGTMVQHVTKEQHAQLTRQQEAGQAGKLLPHQFMMQLDMGLWEDMCAVVPKQDTLMPQRHGSH